MQLANIACILMGNYLGFKMTISLALAWVVTVGSLIGILWVLTGMALRRRRSAALSDALSAALSDGEDFSEFSLDRYRAMERLFSEDDVRFLEAQPGYRREIGIRWKRERRRIFRAYLRELKEDFRKLHAQARELVSQSGAESAGLVEVLMKQQAIFLWATTALEFRLVLHRLGVGKVNAAPLIQLIEAMRLDLAQRAAPETV